MARGAGRAMAIMTTRRAAKRVGASTLHPRDTLRAGDVAGVTPCLAPAATDGVTVPALSVRFVASSGGGFADVAIGRRIAGIAGSGSRTGNRFRLRGRPGVPWGAVRGPGGPGRVRPVGRRAGGFAVAGARASGPTG